MKFEVQRAGKTYCEFALHYMSMDGPQSEAVRQHAGKWLVKSEQDLLKNYTAEKRIHSFLMGRYLAKQSVLELLNRNTMDNYLDFQKLAIKKGVFGQPVVDLSGLLQAMEKPLDNVQVSISHAQKGACAIAFPQGHPMGIDVEYYDAKRLQTMVKKMSAKEHELFDPVIRSHHHQGLVAWTAKEALSKVLLTGLATSFSLYNIKEVAAVDGNGLKAVVAANKYGREEEPVVALHGIEDVPVGVRHGFEEVPAVEQHRVHNDKHNVYEIKFSNFPQYKALVVLISNEKALAVCLPRESSILPVTLLPSERI